MSRRAVAALLLAACGPGPAETGPKGQVEVAAETGPKGQVPKASPCDAAGETLAGGAWLPDAARLAVLVDLDDPALAAASARVEAGAGGRGLPVVAGLALGQLGLQTTIVRGTLARAGLRPRELALVHGPDGAVIWVLRARCDLRDLQAAMASAWGVRGRAVSGGEVAEAPAGSSFPHDVVFLAEDRLALVPAGQATALLRWFTAPAGPPAIGPGAAANGPRPGEVLAEIPPAPVRGVLTGTSLLSGEAVAKPPSIRTIRASAEGLEIDGSLQ